MSTIGKIFKGLFIAGAGVSSVSMGAYNLLTRTTREETKDLIDETIKNDTTIEKTGFHLGKILEGLQQKLNTIEQKITHLEKVDQQLKNEIANVLDESRKMWTQTIGVITTVRSEQLEAFEKFLETWGEKTKE